MPESRSTSPAKRFGAAVGMLAGVAVVCLGVLLAAQVVHSVNGAGEQITNWFVSIPIGIFFVVFGLVMVSSFHDEFTGRAKPPAPRRRRRRGGGRQWGVDVD